MISKFARISLATVFGLSLMAVAQAAPAAGAAAGAPTTPSSAAAATGTKVGTINIEQAIFASNEGRRDFDALSKKFEPKQSELKGLSDEIENLKKQLSTQGDKMNDDAKATLVKQIESKQKSFERTSQDAQEEFQGQQGEIGNRILTKMAPMIVKYAGENGYGIIIDTSQQWPRGPVIWYGQSVDITQPIIEAYNVQSGVAAPAPGSAAAKPATKPAGPGATKPAATPATKPAAPPATKPPSQ
ncbi:MAG: OmpH family outer membrane protein [Acidobacteriia bacterium]|jgi:outer membrane protein|nr:OmpH family outer membrane protein [Terriglobia bacterium]